MEQLNSGPQVRSARTWHLMIGLRFFSPAQLFSHSPALFFRLRRKNRGLNSGAVEQWTAGEISANLAPYDWSPVLFTCSTVLPLTCSIFSPAAKKSACSDTNSRTLIAGRPVTRSTPSDLRSYRPARFKSAIVTRCRVTYSGNPTLLSSPSQSLGEISKYVTSRSSALEYSRAIPCTSCDVGPVSS